jgi:hypothetical protein
MMLISYNFLISRYYLRLERILMDQGEEEYPYI